MLCFGYTAGALAGYMIREETPRGRDLSIRRGYWGTPMKMRACIRWRTLAVAGMVGMLLAPGRSRDVEEPADDGTGLPQLTRLEPGLSVDGAVPKGWTHRVIRSLP